MMYYNTSADRSTGHCTVEIEGVTVKFTATIDGSVFVVADTESYWCTDGRYWQPYATLEYGLYELDLLTSKDGTITITERDAYEFKKLRAKGFTEVSAIPFSEWLSYRPKQIDFDEWTSKYDNILDVSYEHLKYKYGKERPTMYTWEQIMDKECAAHPQWADELD